MLVKWRAGILKAGNVWAAMFWKQIIISSSGGRGGSEGCSAVLVNIAIFVHTTLLCLNVILLRLILMHLAL